MYNEEILGVSINNLLSCVDSQLISFKPDRDEFTWDSMKL